MPTRRSIPHLLLLLLLVACLPEQVSYSPQQGERSWTYADLRAMDAADASIPTHDIIAVYTRSLESQLQIRLDLLDLNTRLDSDLYLALDSAPGGTTTLPINIKAEIEWDTLITIPASGPIEGLTSEMLPRMQLAVRVFRDPAKDTITISLNRDAIPNAATGFTLQIFLTPIGSPSPADSTGPVHSNDRPPPRAPVLFAFWNTLPAYTPALALRRWDGAHTGPHGSRHGLYNLLRAARNHRIPIALLDLKSPAALSALDYLGGVDMVKDMASRELLILPDYTPIFPDISPPSLKSWALSKSAAESRHTAIDFDLPTSPFLYTALTEGPFPGELSRIYKVIFSPWSNSNPTGLTNIFRWGERTVIPIPGYTLSKGIQLQPNLEGPSIEMRRAMVQAALDAAPNEQLGLASILILGGDLPQSTWGEPRIARTALEYINDHPWIHPLNAHDLLSARSSTHLTLDAPLSPVPSALTPSSQHRALLKELQQAPPGPLTDAAWQAYLALFSPVYPGSPDLATLRANYLGTVGALLAASHWASNPSQIANCDSDPDLDGQLECILASDDVFTLFEPRDGTLTFAFMRSQDGVIHQFLAPSSQFITGLGEPSTWDPSLGQYADPNVIHGAFSDGNTNSEAAYQVTLKENRITFSSPDSFTSNGILQKSFTLTSKGIRVEYRINEPVSVEIPIALDPWVRFTPGWGDLYDGDILTNGWRWGTSPGPYIEVKSTGRISPEVFTDSRDRMSVMENPNFDYPPGHYLPFPLALVGIHADGDFSVHIDLIP